MGIPASLSSVPDVAPYIQYVASSGQTVYPYPFPITQDADLVVVINGVSQSTDSTYSVSGVGVTAGGNVTLNAGSTTGDIVTLYRDIQIERISQIAQNSGFSSIVFNNEFNNFYLIAQQLQSSIAQCLQIPNTNSPPVSTILTPAAYASKYLAFDINGNPTPAVLTSSGALTQAIISNLAYPQTTAEFNAGVVPVNTRIPSHDVLGKIIVDRYGVSANGTNDIGPAFNNAVKVSLQTLGSGVYGCPIEFLAGAYTFATAPAWGSLGTNILPIDVGGQGEGSTQIYCKLTAGSSALFPMGTYNGWRLHDFAIAGDSAHKNDGIDAGNVSATEGIEWRVERITSYMPGVGLKIQNTNTGVYRDFRHWPGNNEALIIPQTVTNSDISHGVYYTGNFTHNISGYDLFCPPNSNYSSTMRGVKCDAVTADGCALYTPLVQTGSGNNNETGIDWNPSGSTAGLTIENCYNEGTIISLGNVGNSVVSSLTDGGTLGSLVLNAGSRNNTFIGINQAVLNVSSSTSYGNLFLGGAVRTTWTDATIGANISVQPNQYKGFSTSGYGTGIADVGRKMRKILAYSASMQPDTYYADTNEIRVNNTSNFAFLTPLHPYNGAELKFVIRNENASSAMGTMTVNGLNGGLVGWTPPAAGKNRAFSIFYSSDFGTWYQDFVGQADVAN